MLSSRFATKLFLLEYKNTITKRTYVEFKNPIQRTIDAITGDVKSKFLNKNTKSLHPEHADVVIIGGGYLGSSGAYWLKTRAGEGLNVVVLEKQIDKYISKNWSTGILSQHYSLPENILLSQFSADFFRNIKQKINKDINIKFHPHGYIVLASDNYAEKLEKNVTILKEFGIKNELLSVEQLRKNYPWINTSDVKLGCISTENEGVFDSHALLQGLVQKSQELGAIYVHGEVIGFDSEYQRDVLMEGVRPMSLQKIQRIIYRTEDGVEHSIKFAICVLAAGTESTNIAKLASIGNKDGLLQLPLPVDKKESNVYSVECDTSNPRPGLSAPIVMDTSGLWLRRNGLQNNLLCGQIPLKSDKPLTPDENFELLFKPSLENRFPQFANSKIKKWDTEVYDCNNFDDSGIIGAHPYHTNLIFATGFGRLGVQHAPGIGKAISDLVIESQYTGVDLTRMGFDRILINEPLVDFNIY